ncbi:MAG: type I DNA topoisomerase [Eubacteriales bacterium]|nr:type I DNA topoisomerase [Eubacteriales bacterium]
MSRYLVIVESPAKAKTIKKYLGSSYTVQASMGHLRDLPKSQLGVDIENDFEPRYITIRGKGDLLSKLKKHAKNADKVFLATDPDREGEAISWHLQQVLNIEPEKTCRVAFNEITQTAVKSAIKAPRQIDLNLVDAQQARRVLDRIVGYTISPLLWKKVKKGLSAGRVQSVATRLVVDREKEIENFQPVEFWSIAALMSQKDGKQEFTARFHGGLDGRKTELHNKEKVDEILSNIKNADYVVKNVKKSDKSKTPAAPFTTSTLQQEASRKLNYTSKKTMQVAQILYEGVDIKGKGTVGLITYMRTDSLRISDEAQASARQFIAQTYGAEFNPAKIRQFRTKKNAQDAHEAIRPTDVELTPQMAKQILEPSLYRLYKLIWERFVASQMANAIYDTIQADIQADKYIFKASGSKIKFQGFTKVYVESLDVTNEEEQEEKEGKLPLLEKGESLDLKKLDPKQSFTQPPARYTEATLIKAMEDDGIGRPSTYAPTISTILARGYIIREAKSLLPTELGIVVTDLMKNYFADIVNVEFSAHMEDLLDGVEEGSQKWRNVIADFYGPFETVLKKAEDEIGKIQVADEVSDVPCEKCGRMMVYKMGRFGKFLACPGFPECRNTKNIVVELNDVPCPKCGGKILIRNSKRGKVYYGCEHNPSCDFMTWDKPINEKCEICGSIKVEKRARGAVKHICSNKECENSK